MKKQTLSLKQYLAELPPERSREVEKVWRIVRKNMPKGFTEAIDGKYLSFKADGEWYVALANQKNYISLHLVPMYVFPELKAKFDASGKKLKCGKGCINFNTADQLPLEIIGEIVRANDAEGYKKHMTQLRSQHKDKRKAEKTVKK